MKHFASLRVHRSRSSSNNFWKPNLKPEITFKCFFSPLKVRANSIPVANPTNAVTISSFYRVSKSLRDFEYSALTVTITLPTYTITNTIRPTAIVNGPPKGHRAPRKSTEHKIRRIGDIRALQPDTPARFLQRRWEKRARFTFLFLDEIREKKIIWIYYAPSHDNKRRGRKTTNVPTIKVRA